VKPITFDVAGDPVPQPRARISTRGGFGRAYVPQKHPVHAYRRAIAFEAMKAGATPGRGRVSVVIDAVFVRPAYHKTKSGLKVSAPDLPRQDVDNIAKAVLDALNGVAWVDDTQVSRLVVEKSYGTEGRTTVRIS
jgi:Holliday junction resolvase RusA-like endonuclease